jgi:hypothetical protein
MLNFERQMVDDQDEEEKILVLVLVGVVEVCFFGLELLVGKELDLLS